MGVDIKIGKTCHDPEDMEKLSSHLDVPSLTEVYKYTYQELRENEAMLKKHNIGIGADVDEQFCISARQHAPGLLTRIFRHNGAKAFLIALDYELCRRTESDVWGSQFILRDEHGEPLPKKAAPVPRTHALKALKRMFDTFLGLYHEHIKEWELPAAPFEINIDLGDANIKFTI